MGRLGCAPRRLHHHLLLPSFTHDRGPVLSVVRILHLLAKAVRGLIKPLLSPRGSVSRHFVVIGSRLLCHNGGLGDVGVASLVTQGATLDSPA